MKEKIELSEGTEEKSEELLITSRLNLGVGIAQAMIVGHVNCNIFEMIIILFPEIAKLANISRMKVQGYFNDEKKLQLAAKLVKNFLVSNRPELLENIKEICQKDYPPRLLQVFIEQLSITTKVVVDEGRIRLKFDPARETDLPAMFGATLTD